MRINWWLTGVGAFTAVLFGILAFVSYRAYTIRHENYYLASTLVYGAVAVLSIYAIINKWRITPPPERPDDPDSPPDE